MVKKLFALLLALMMLLSLTACGGDKTPPADSGGDVQQEQQNTPNPAEGEDAQSPDDGDADLSGYLGTKTGKFYSQFAGR